MRSVRKSRVVARSRTPRGDIALVTTLLVIGLLEAGWVLAAERPLALALVVLLAIPLLWRTSHPAAVAIFVTCAIVVQLPWLPLRLFDQTFIGFIAVVLAFYALGRHGREPWSTHVFAGCSLAFAGTLGWYDRSFGSFVLALVFVAAAAVTGRVVAQRCELRDLLDRQAEALGQSADVAELTRVAEVRGRIAGEVQDLVSRRVHEMVERSVEARRLLQHDRGRAVQLVAEVEADGRSALNEMRLMLGVLRSTDLWSATSLSPWPGPVARTRRLRWLPLPRVELILLAAFVVLLLGESLITPGEPPISSLTLLPPLLAFLVGTRLRDGASLAGLGLALGGVAAVNVFFVQGQWGDYVFPSVLVALAWLGGRLLRSQNDLVQKSWRGAAALERSIAVRSEAAATQERLRLARELHDVLAHTLMLMVVQAGGARRSIQTGRPGAEQALRVVEETGRDATTELRRLLRLVDPLVEPAGAPDAAPGLDDLRSLVARAQDAGLIADLLIEGEPFAIPSGVALATYRVAQEAVTNVIRHAQATQVRLTLRYGPGQLLHLEVRDDGRCDPGAPGGSGNGLTGMHERTAIYDGRLVAGPVPGDGYVVSATFPLAASRQGSPA